jgi:hypothetical protein
MPVVAFDGDGEPGSTNVFKLDTYDIDAGHQSRPRQLPPRSPNNVQ